MDEDQIRAQYPGISDDLVKQILSLQEGDPSIYAKQYEQGAYLRRFATGDSAKSGFGAIAQTIAGALSRRQDREYADMLRNYHHGVTNARTKWWEERYPKSISGMPEQLSGPGMNDSPDSIPPIGDAVY